jgi:hypothetical protein
MDVAHVHQRVLAFLDEHANRKGLAERRKP